MGLSASQPLSSAVLLELLPHAEPFRFVQDVIEVDASHVVVSAQLLGSEFFYRGHFPDAPITPGVILLESMAQAMSLQAYYLLATELSVPQARRFRMLLTDCEMDVRRPVIPPAGLRIVGQVLFWRARKLRSRVELFDAHSKLIATARVSVVGIARE